METHTPVFLPGESNGQRSLVGYSPWGHKQSGHSVSVPVSPIMSLNVCVSVSLCFRLSIVCLFLVSV